MFTISPDFKENPRSTLEAEACVRPQLFLYCSQLQYNLLYSAVSCLCVDRNSTSLAPTRSLFQVRPPLLVPCSCVSLAA
jgi:hypothetical protein